MRAKGGVGAAGSTSQQGRIAIQWTTEYIIYVLPCQVRRQYRIMRLDHYFQVDFISGPAHHLS